MFFKHRADGDILFVIFTRMQKPWTVFFLPFQIRIQNLLTEEGLVKRSTDFEEAIAGGERSALRNFCESKASAAV